MKVLIIEDRIIRQQNFLKDFGTDIFKKYVSVLDNKNGDNFKQLQESFQKKNFEVLNNYDCIVLHRSAFDAEIKSLIFEFCKAHKKYLVYFSGGISSVTLEESIGFSFLTINSKDFYSNNLDVFLDNIEQKNEINLGLLAFGQNWELNLLLSLRQRMSLGFKIDKEQSKCDVSEIISAYKIQSNYIVNLFSSKLEWFKEGTIVDDIQQKIFQMKEITQQEINNKVLFE